MIRLLGRLLRAAVPRAGSALAVGGTTAFVGAILCFPTVWPHGNGDSQHDPKPPKPGGLVEARHCGRGHGQYRAGTGSEGSHGGSPLSQEVTVVVPKTAVIELDRKGRIVAAMTNTGCAPRRGDDLYYRRPDGRIQPAPGSAIKGQDWSGDFRSAGVFVRQR